MALEGRGLHIAQLRYFTTIAKPENVSRAAQLLHLSQSSLSKNLAKLAAEVRTPLFDHSGKRLTLNPAFIRKYFPNGGGSIFTFEVKGDAQKAKDFIDNLELFSLLANVADVKSLVIHPATTTHSQCTEEELLDQGIKPNTIRLSIGTENIDDIIQDLEEAFKAVC